MENNKTKYWYSESKRKMIKTTSDIQLKHPDLTEVEEHDIILYKQASKSLREPHKIEDPIKRYYRSISRYKDELIKELQDKLQYLFIKKTVSTLDPESNLIHTQLSELLLNLTNDISIKNWSPNWIDTKKIEKLKEIAEKTAEPFIITLTDEELQQYQDKSYTKPIEEDYSKKLRDSEDLMRKQFQETMSSYYNSKKKKVIPIEKDDNSKEHKERELEKKIERDLLIRKLQAATIEKDDDNSKEHKDLNDDKIKTE